MSKRLIASITLASFSSLAVPAVALPGSSLAKVNASSGKVLAKVDGPNWVDASNDVLEEGSLLRTGADGSAVVQVGEGNFLRLAPNTQVKVVSVSGGEATVALERGRIVGQVGSKLKVDTDRTSTFASQGEFVVQTSAEGTGLDVLSGNARLMSRDGDVMYGVDGVDSDALASDGLNSVQYYGDVTLLDDQWKGKWKGKGGGARSDDDDESVGGSSQTSPDSSVRRPIRRPVRPVQPTTPPPTYTPPTTPPPTFTPPTTPPPVVTTPPVTPPPVVAGGGFPWWATGLIGAAAVGGIVALVNDDDDDDTIVVNPSPSTN